MEQNQTIPTLLNPANPADMAIIAEILPQSNEARNATENAKFLHAMRFKLGMRDSLYSNLVDAPDYDADMTYWNLEYSNFNTLYPSDMAQRLQRDSSRQYDLFLEGRANGLSYDQSLEYARNQSEVVKTKNRSKK